MFPHSFLLGVFSIVPLLAYGSDDKEQAPINDGFSCIYFEGPGPTVQLWAMPDRPDLKLETICDKHLPVLAVPSVGTDYTSIQGTQNRKAADR